MLEIILICLVIAVISIILGFIIGKRIYFKKGVGDAALEYSKGYEAGFLEAIQRMSKESE